MEGASGQEEARIVELLRGLYELALECGWRWDGERWSREEDQGVLSAA